MNPTAEQAELLRQELHEWLEKHELQHGLNWLTAEERYGEANKKSAYYKYFYLEFGESEFYYVANSYAAPPRLRDKFEGLAIEFNQMLRNRGFWKELDTDTSLDIVGRPREHLNE